MMSLLAVSGLPYKHHDLFFNLKISPQRAHLERHVGLIAELCESMKAAEGGDVAVYVATHDRESAPYKFVLALLEHHGVQVSPHTACRVLYHMPDDGGAEAPGVVHDVGHTNYYVLHPADVKYDIEYTYDGKDRSRNQQDRWHNVTLRPTSDPSEPPYMLMVLRDPLYFVHRQFVNHFAYELDDSKGQMTLTYNNLVNLCIMVKNAGPLFEEVLRENMKYADRWTVLDTGSTDETLDIINRVLVGKHRGALHQEPFINFRDSRNRCLELASRACKYNIMLDDTYIVRGDVRSFLETVRGDEFASSFSFYIKSDDTEYTTNRVTRTELGLRYIFKIHEVIQSKDNVNVMIPREIAHLDDLRAEYMEKRTMARKQYDLQLLLESIAEEPEQPRHLYYTAQTYALLEDYENAAKYFKLRAESELEGFNQERVDACFELARTKQFRLFHPWSEAREWYLKTLELEPLRVDALYFLGIYHVYDGRNDEDEAFTWFERAFHLGYPVQTQYSLKPTLVFYYLPRFLAPLCYTRNKWQLGYDACTRLLTNYTEPYMAKVVDPHVVKLMLDYRDIYAHLLKLPAPAQIIGGRHVDIVFVVDGNWSAWTGADIERKGLGGSETWAVEMATHMKQCMPNGSVVFFCNCDERSLYKGVEFLPIGLFEPVMATHHVSTCIVSRFSHYTFVPLHTQCDQVLLYLHDLGPTGNLLPVHKKLKNVYCLSPWHRDLFSANFPQHAARTKSLGYGIDRQKWKPGVKQRHSFTFSSFPDRGLLPLLQMWPRIRQLFPDATLAVFCKLDHEHVRRVNGPMMAEIDRLLALPAHSAGVTVHGWVPKAALAAAYSTAEYWLYPCIFDETFCLTALEAVASGVIGIAPPKAALQHMPLCFVPGDALSTSWADSVLHLLSQMDADTEYKQVVVQNGLTFASERSWQRQALLLLNECSAVSRANIHSPLSSSVLTPFYSTPRDVVARVHAMSCGKLSFTVTNSAQQPALQFNWLHQWLQKHADPVEALTKFVSTTETGFIETPSPMLELLRGVDVDAGARKCRGYFQHRYIMWTHENVLHIVPKLPCIEQMEFVDEERLWYECVNVYPIFWHNYMSYSGKAMQYMMHDVTHMSVAQYRQLLLLAVRESALNTKTMFPQWFLPNQLDGSPISVAPLWDAGAHLRGLMRMRCSAVTEHPLYKPMQALKDGGFEPRVIYDIGACVLEWAAMAKHVWPDATIVLFDAMEHLGPLYEESGYLHHIGVLGEEDDKQVDFYENATLPFGNSRFREVGSVNAAVIFSDAQKQQRRLQRLDTVVQQRGFPLPDFVKMDVQGSEYAVLAGGMQTLGHASHLLVELALVEYNLGAPTMDAVVQQLASMKFHMSQATPVADTSYTNTPDYLFVKTT